MNGCGLGVPPPSFPPFGAINLQCIISFFFSQIVVYSIDGMPLVPPLRTQFAGEAVALGEILQRHALAVCGSGIGHGQLRHGCAGEHEDAEAGLEFFLLMD